MIGRHDFSHTESNSTLLPAISRHGQNSSTLLQPINVGHEARTTTFGAAAASQGPQYPGQSNYTYASSSITMSPHQYHQKQQHHQQHQQQQHHHPRQPPPLNLAAACATNASSSAPIESVSYSSAIPYYNGSGSAISSMGSGPLFNASMSHHPTTSQQTQTSVGYSSAPANVGFNLPISQSASASAYVSHPPVSHSAASYTSRFSDVTPLTSSHVGQYDFHAHPNSHGHSNGFEAMPHGQGFGTHTFDAGPMIAFKSKRRQVKNACVNCQRACKRCDEGRPCSRCVKYGLIATCVDSARKERKRGIKRGPYKRRSATGSQPTSSVAGSATSIGHATSSSMIFGHSAGSGTSMSSSSTHQNTGAGSYSLLSGAGSFSATGGQVAVPAHINGQYGDTVRSLENGTPSELNSQLEPHAQSRCSPRLGIISNPAPLSNQRVTLTGLSSMSVDTLSTSSGIPRDQVSTMQPPLSGRPNFLRNDYERPSLANVRYPSSASLSGIAAAQSAPASTTNFNLFANNLPSGTSGRAGNVLYSPSAPSGPLMSATNAQLSSAGQHGRYQQAESTNSNFATPSNGSGASSTQSPRTPLGPGSGSGSAGAMQGSLTGSDGHYVHHPGSTTTAAIAPSTAGAFLNPPVSSNSQPFPLHIPQSARFRGSSSIAKSEGFGQESRSSRYAYGHEDDYTVNLEPRYGGSNDADSGGLAPLKLVEPGSANMTQSLRYQLPSPRMNEARSRSVMTATHRFEGSNSTDVAAYGSA